MLLNSLRYIIHSNLDCYISVPFSTTTLELCLHNLPSHLTLHTDGAYAAHVPVLAVSVLSICRLTYSPLASILLTCSLITIFEPTN
jgi:D-arabinose 1-dehydrogenase-like Zn-dependent alcohol dehydrogenase